MTSGPALPPEVLGEIAGSLCLHCSPSAAASSYLDGYDEHRWSSDEAARVGTLASLCLTSRVLSNAAGRHLYHCPMPEKWSLLARTLITSRDKAQHVRDLRLGQFDWPDGDSMVPDEVQAYYHDRVRAYTPVPNSDDDHPDGEFDAERFSDYNLTARVHAEGWKHYNNNVVVDIITSLCPDVERLEATLGYFGSFYLCAPSSLAALKQVDLRHYDTENGLDLHDLVHLFRAAPNITTMRLRQVSMEGAEDDQDDDDEDPGKEDRDLPLTLDHLRSLEMYNSAVGAGALGLILRACPNLETLSYDAGGGCIGYRQFTPLQAKNMILSYAPQLKRFQLDLTYGDLDDGDVENGLEEAAQALESRGVQFTCV